MISRKIMNDIYNKVKTTVKLGAVIKNPGVFNDSPVVFKHGNSYYMSYIEIDNECKGGYSTHIAESCDLIHFNEVGRVLTSPSEWDTSQCGGYAQYINNDFGGNNEIEKIDGKYVFAYVGGTKPGYETDPLSMGAALTDDFCNDESYLKLDKPVLSGDDSDARVGERLTIYKADMFIDSKRTLSHKYVCAYNAKDFDNRESIFLAVSDDGINYKRYGDSAVIDVRQCSDENKRRSADSSD